MVSDNGQVRDPDLMIAFGAAAFGVLVAILATLFALLTTQDHRPASVQIAALVEQEKDFFLHVELLPSVQRQVRSFQSLSLEPLRRAYDAAERLKQGSGSSDGAAAFVAKFRVALAAAKSGTSEPDGSTKPYERAVAEQTRLLSFLRFVCSLRPDQRESPQNLDQAGLVGGYIMLDLWATELARSTAITTDYTRAVEAWLAVAEREWNRGGEKLFPNNVSAAQAWDEMRRHATDAPALGAHYLLRIVYCYGSQVPEAGKVAPPAAVRQAERVPDPVQGAVVEFPTGTAVDSRGAVYAGGDRQFAVCYLPMLKQGDSVEGASSSTVFWFEPRGTRGQASAHATGPSRWLNCRQDVTFTVSDLRVASDLSSVVAVGLPGKSVKVTSIDGPAR